jgi:hypothetical protein
VEDGIQVYGVNWTTGGGELVLGVDNAVLDATQPAETTLLAENGLARLYRLADGNLQLNYGPYRDTQIPANLSKELEYAFTWRTCGATTSRFLIWDVNTGETALSQSVP